MTISILPPKLYIDELRKKANLSDQAIGESVGLSRTSVWRLRMGIHGTTGLEHGVRLANLYAKVFQNNE